MSSKKLTKWEFFYVKGDRTKKLLAKSDYFRGKNPL